MIQLVQISLENEMDLTIAYKRSIKAAELLGLSLSTQTAFATAVSEVCREVIDKTHEGSASIEVHNEAERYSLAAIITYKEVTGMESLQGGIQYAKKLIPMFSYGVKDSTGTIELKLGIPRSAMVNRLKIITVKDYFGQAEPNTPYEEVRQRNLQLFLINEESEIALKQEKYLNEQKNEFLSVAGHELKTPLTILRAYTQMALRTDCGETTLAHLKKIDTQAQKLQTMILQLLDISKIEKGNADYNLEKTDLTSYLTDMSDLIRQLVPSHELIIEMDHGDIELMIDRLRMEQVIMNIVGNAAKYSPAGRKINLRTKIIENNELQISVEDEGIGMSEEELLKVFAKFYRVSDVTRLYNGLGMGLYICSKIIKDHGGKIWVESIHGTSSTFYFTIPVPI
jgi:signal transduction histidine kinase